MNARAVIDYLFANSIMESGRISDMCGNFEPTYKGEVAPRHFTFALRGSDDVARYADVVYVAGAGVAYLVVSDVVRGVDMAKRTARVLGANFGAAPYEIADALIAFLEYEVRGFPTAMNTWGIKFVKNWRTSRLSLNVRELYALLQQDQ